MHAEMPEPDDDDRIYVTGSFVVSAFRGEDAKERLADRLVDILIDKWNGWVCGRQRSLCVVDGVDGLGELTGGDDLVESGIRSIRVGFGPERKKEAAELEEWLVQRVLEAEKTRRKELREKEEANERAEFERLRQKYGGEAAT
jgi:hypothetical protein